MAVAGARQGGRDDVGLARQPVLVDPGAATDDLLGGQPERRGDQGRGGCGVADAEVSTEPAQSLALAKLGLDPLLDLGLRLGEGSGAVAAVPVVRSAAALLRGTALLSEVLT